MSTVRVAVIGCGWWATAVHLPAIVANPSAILCGVCDANLDKARAAATHFGAPMATDRVSELLATEPDAVVVATPQDAHVAPGIAAIEAGADVLIEKPMALTGADAEKLVDAAAAAGVRLHVGYPFLYTKAVRQLRDMVAAGTLGPLGLATALFATRMRDLFAGNGHTALCSTPGALVAPDPSTYADRHRHGGQAASQLSHALGVLIHVAGDTVDDVFGFTDETEEHVDFNAAVTFRTRRGTTLTAASSGLAVDQEQRLEEYRFLGTHGHAKLDTVCGTLEWVLETGQRSGVGPDDDSGIYPVAAPLDRLIAARQGRAEVLVRGELGVEVAKVLEVLLFKTKVIANVQAR